MAKPAKFTPYFLGTDNKRLVAAAEASSHGRIEIRDSQSRLCLRVTAKGDRSFVTRPRFKGQPLRLTFEGVANIDNYPAAKAWADQIADTCAAGRDPREEKKRAKIEAGARLFGPIVERFMKEHGSKKRTGDETQRIFDRYVLPKWRDRIITEITRRDVNELTAEIADRAPVMADRTLAAVSKLFNWYAVQDEAFRTPVVRGMKRTIAKERARHRVLSDAEIRLLWPMLDGFPTFGGLVKTLFLTAQRREEVAGMKRREIGEDGIWGIGAERYKTKSPQFVPLSDAARSVIDAQDVIDGSDLVFTTTGETPFSGFAKAKERLDTMMLDALLAAAEADGRDGSKVYLEHWQLHDIRRTARTLMTRAGVRPDIAERVLGHVIAGVAGIYDRHAYAEEKRDALEKLAVEVAKIVAPVEISRLFDHLLKPANNVVPMRVAL